MNVHTPTDHDVIAAELVACTLGARRRPELRTDWVGAVNRAFGVIRRGLRDLAGVVS